MQTIQIVKQSASYYLRVTLGEVEGLTTRMLRGSREGVASGVADSGIHRLANALHLLPHRATTVDSVGIKLDSHGLWVEVIETDLNLKYVLLATSLNLHVAEV